MFSVNKTLSRPDFYWISPWTRLDNTNAILQRGEPDLNETKVWNYNLTANLYNNFLGLFSISAFNKDLKDIFYRKVSQVVDEEDIIRLQIPGREGGYRMTSYANSEKARVWGLEFELQTQLMLIPGIPDFLRGVVVNANYSRIWSKTYFPFDKIIGYKTIPNTRPPRRQAIYENWEREGPMPGQARQIANLSLGYDIDGLSTRLSLLYQGPSISGVGEIAETDTWNNSFWRWDMSLKYRFTDYLSFTFNLINITSQSDRSYYGSDLYPTSEYYYGMSGIAGIEISL
jgi:TonB-dependent receptor